MLPLGEKPLLEHLIEWNVSNGIRDIILCTSYLGRIIQDYFDDGGQFGVDIRYSTSRRPLATAGQLRTASEMVSGTFACMYGDSIYDFDLAAMARFHKERGATVTMALHAHPSVIPYGVIETDDSGMVISWNEKPHTTHQINTGCYIMEQEVFSHIPSDKPWGMDSVIRDLMEDGRTVLGYHTSGRFQDVGTIDAYNQISSEYRQRLGDI